MHICLECYLLMRIIELNANLFFIVSHWAYASPIFLLFAVIRFEKCMTRKMRIPTASYASFLPFVIIISLRKIYRCFPLWTSFVEAARQGHLKHVISVVPAISKAVRDRSLLASTYLIGTHNSNKLHSLITLWIMRLITCEYRMECTFGNEHEMNFSPQENASSAVTIVKFWEVFIKGIPIFDVR